QKALRSLEIGSYGLESGLDGRDPEAAREELWRRLARPSSRRIYDLTDALRAGIGRDEIHRLTHIDPWFIDTFAELIESEQRIAHKPLGPELLREAKAQGFSDYRIGKLTGADEAAVARARREHSVRPVFKAVDTCGAEFQAFTPYLYSTHEGEDEAPPDQ